VSGRSAVLPLADYAAVDAVNWSTLREIEKSELHYRYRLRHPREDSARLAFGRLVHTAILEPERADYAVFGGDRRTRAWRDFREQAQADGRACASAEDIDTAHAMAEAVHRHPVAGRLLSACRAELSLFWCDPETGLDCKARLDALTPRTIVELKTVASADPWEFGRVCARLGYHKQLAFQRRGVKAVFGRRRTAVRIIAVEIDPPHDVVVFKPDEDALWSADRTLDELLSMAATALRRSRPRGRSDKLLPLHLPPWAYDELGDMAADDADVII